MKKGNKCEMEDVIVKKMGRDVREDGGGCQS